MRTQKYIVGRRVFVKRLNDLLISLTALALTLATFVLIAAVAALLSGCAVPKYEVARTNKWIVKDGYVVGEKGKPNVKEEKTEAKNPTNNPNAGKYCENEKLNNGVADRNIKPDRFNRFNRDRDLNNTNRNATLALYKGKPIDAIEEAWVRSLLPNTQIEIVRRSPATNFYTIFLASGQIVYVNPSQRLLFFGEIYANDGENLTNASKERFAELKATRTALEINASELEALGFGEIEGDRFIAMVYSPLCPYCHRADAFFTNAQIPVKRIFMVDLHSPNDEGVKRSVEFLTTADKKEREALLVKWRSAEGYEAPLISEELTEALKAAVERLTAMNKFVERNKIEGTPYIYLINRKTNKVERLLTGYNAPIGEQINDWFQGDKQ